MKSFVYCITNTINGKRYVGKSNDPKQRFGAHLYAAERGDETRLYRAIRKYGPDKFEMTIISEHESEADAFSAEHSLVLEWRTHLVGYNMNEGGEGSFSPSDETREKKRRSAMGRVQSEETRRKISETRKARKIPSPPKSEDGIRRIREANLGVKRDPSVGQNISKRAIERRELGLKRKSAIGVKRKPMSEEGREVHRQRLLKYWKQKRELVKLVSDELESFQQEETQTLGK
jgi:group I intron endonuclease